MVCLTQIGPERWTPDTAMVFTLRTRSLKIKDLTDPDRAWIVASLTVEGWTVEAIAKKLSCSLRLIQQIKAWDLTTVAIFALDKQRQLHEEHRMRHLESRVAAQEVEALKAQIARLITQRDCILESLSRRMKERNDGTQDMPRM